MDRIRFDNVSKRYVLGQNADAREALSRAARRILGREPASRRELWSLRDVSFTVRDGESLGIIGRNGAGKSTVLKILTRITPPTQGVSRTRGRVAALLEVGTGFHPELTGQENVFLNGAILGMSRRDIAARFDDIVEFAGTGKFLDTPLKRYSSGMQLRLAFAVAAHLEPDMLIVDEILAVGDAEFQRKCLGRMAEAEKEGRTVVFVSHDLDALSRLCSRALWLEAGSLRSEGPTRRLVHDYLASGYSSEGTGFSFETEQLAVRRVEVRSHDGEAVGAATTATPLTIHVDFDVLNDVPGLDVGIFVTTENGVRVFDEAHRDQGLRPLPPGSYTARLPVPPILTVGTFSVGLWLGTAHEDIVYEPAVARVTLTGNSEDRPERVVALGLPLTVDRRVVEEHQ